MLQVAADRKHVSFMYSYPNYVPLSAAAVGHVEKGEERFLVEWDRADDAVWYDILAFSRPNHALTRLGYPVVRRLQRRFGRDSAAAMIRAVRHTGHGDEK